MTQDEKAKLIDRIRQALLLDPDLEKESLESVRQKLLDQLKEEQRKEGQA